MTEEYRCIIDYSRCDEQLRKRLDEQLNRFNLYEASLGDRTIHNGVFSLEGDDEIGLLLFKNAVDRVMDDYRLDREKRGVQHGKR